MTGEFSEKHICLSRISREKPLPIEDFQQKTVDYDWNKSFFIKNCLCREFTVYILHTLPTIRIYYPEKNNWITTIFSKKSIEYQELKKNWVSDFFPGNRWLTGVIREKVWSLWIFTEKLFAFGSFQKHPINYRKNFEKSSEES